MVHVTYHVDPAPAKPKEEYVDPLKGLIEVSEYFPYGMDDDVGR